VRSKADEITSLI